MADNASKKQYLNSFINDSPTVRIPAGANINGAAHKAVKFDGDGNVILATTGDTAIGVVLSTVRADEESGVLVTKKGYEIDVLVKDIGLIEAGAQIAKGDALTVNTSGLAIPAQSGNFIFGFAFTAAESAGELVQIQITRSGYKA